jgi:hypothetical protein
MIGRISVAAILMGAMLIPAGFVHAQGRGGGGANQSANIRQANELMRGGKIADAIAAAKKELETDPNTVSLSPPHVSPRRQRTYDYIC